MKYFFLLFFTIAFCSCWKFNADRAVEPAPQLTKVWGSKPVYGIDTVAKKIYYMGEKQPIAIPGNIYAFGKYIFQVDIGRGIHVIDNTIPAQADRIGFIVVKSCSQISIRGRHLYTNSYDDLVTIDIADPVNLREVGRLKNVFPSYRANYPLVAPDESGYYNCPRTDSIVVGWVKDSIYATCFKN